MATLNVNTDACVTLTDRLERLNRSAFPVAVRQTLNRAAFDVKFNTLHQSAANNFIRRSPNFFKTFSAVNKAQGFNVNSMSAEVGMTDRGKPTARTAVAHMEEQESGGVIRDGADYLAGARGGNNARKVTASNRFNKNKLISGKFSRGGTSKSRFVAAAVMAAKLKKNVSINTSRGRFLMQVTSVRKTKGGVKINSKLLIKDRSGKPVTIKATNFSQEAAHMTMKKMDDFYRIEAEKQFARALKL